MKEVMKVNFNKPFTDCFGKELEGKNIGEQVCLHLFNLSTMQGKPVPPERKYMAYNLCNRIYQNPEKVEISIDEGVFIKEVCNEVFSAGAFGQIVDLIENNN